MGQKTNPIGLRLGIVKTWARRCTVLPEFVGHTLAVHNGNKFSPI